MSEHTNPNASYYPSARKYPFLKGYARKALIAAACLPRYLKVYYQGIKKPKGNLRAKFMVACIPRSGSSLLGSLLKSHPEIHWDNEKFHVNFLAPTLLSNGLAHRSHWLCYGVKLFLHQISPEADLRSVVSLVDKMSQDGWRFISLIRENSLRHALSMERFRRGEESYRLTGETHQAREKIYLDVGEFLRLLEWVDAFKKAQRFVFSTVPHLSVIYEDHLEDGSMHQTTVDDIFEYLGISTCPVSTPHVRQSARSLRQEIENYDEFVDVISHTAYIRYLPDDYQGSRGKIW